MPDFPHVNLRNLIQTTDSVMQALLIIPFIHILTSTLSAAAAVPDSDFFPSLNWLLGEPTVLDPVEESLEQQPLEQEYPYKLNVVQDDSAELDPIMFEATPSEPTFIDPALYDPTLLDSDGLDPGLLDPSDPDSFDLSRERPNCGNSIFGVIWKEEIYCFLPFTL